MSREPSITRHTRNRLVWLSAAALLVASVLFPNQSAQTDLQGKT